MDAAAWEAIGTWVGGGAAVGGLGYAGLQLRRDRIAREEAAQPSVVAFMEFRQSGTQVDFVVRNYGPTVANDVRISADPPLTRAPQNLTEIEQVWLPAKIPSLAPGQEWRTIWDHGGRRFKPNSATREHFEFKVDVTFTGLRDKSITTTAVLDWRQFFDPEVRDGVHYAATKDLSHVVKGLDDIATAVASERKRRS